MLNNNSIKKEKKLIGVGGILLFLCIYLAILVPIISGGISLSPRIIQKLTTDIYSIINFILILLLIGLSLVSGILLWLKKKVGIVTATIYFIIIIVFSIMDSIVILQNVANVGNSLNMKIIYGILIPILFLIYLKKSKRVANTYK